MAPVLVNLAAIDLRTLLVAVTVAAVLGYGVLVAVLFAISAVVAYVHAEEDNRVRLFELGILASAMLTGLLNAKNVELPVPSSPGDDRAARISFFAPAWAAGRGVPKL